jgi:hypothetical protein
MGSPAQRRARSRADFSTRTNRLVTSTRPPGVPFFAGGCRVDQDPASDGRSRGAGERVNPPLQGARWVAANRWPLRSSARGPSCAPSHTLAVRVPGSSLTMVPCASLAAIQAFAPPWSCLARVSTAGRDNHPARASGANCRKKPSPNCSTAGSRSDVWASGAPLAARPTSSRSSFAKGAGSKRNHRDGRGGAQTES